MRGQQSRTFCKQPAAVGGEGCCSSHRSMYLAASECACNFVHVQVCTGALGGLVSITAGCSVLTPYSAVVAGVVSAPIVVYGNVMMEYLKIDDPVSLAECGCAACNLRTGACMCIHALPASAACRCSGAGRRWPVLLMALAAHLAIPICTCRCWPSRCTACAASGAC